MPEVAPAYDMSCPRCGTNLGRVRATWQARIACWMVEPDHVPMDVHRATEPACADVDEVCLTPVDSPLQPADA